MSLIATLTQVSLFILVNLEGFVYQIWRMEGQFYQKLSFKKYPLDRHQVMLEFEV